MLIHLHKKHVVQTQCSVDSTIDIHSTVMSRKMLKLPVVDFDPVKLFLKELEVSRACCPFLAYIHIIFIRIVSQNLLYSSMISMVETTLLSYGDLTYVYPILLRYVPERVYNGSCLLPLLYLLFILYIYI